MSENDEVDVWAAEQFGGTDLGDKRRTARLVRVASSAARSPAGKVSAVFDDDAERQGAYDFLESPHVAAAQLEAGVGATWFFLGGFGVAAEMVGDVFYGAGTREKATTTYPVLSGQLGFVVAYEVLP